MLVSAAAFKTSNYLGMLQALGVATGRAQRLPQLRHVVRMGSDTTPGMLNWPEFLAAAGQAETLPPATVQQCHEAINIQFASGATGAPKGATLTHHNIVNNGMAVARCMRFTETGPTPSEPQSACAKAGCTPVTWPPWMPRATATSLAG